MARNDIHDFLHGLVSGEKLASEDLSHLSFSDLEALMGVETEEEKVAYAMACGPSDENWLQQFSYTELYDKAIALAEKELTLEREELKQRLARKRTIIDDSLWNKRDQLRLEKDQLVLELHKKKAKDQKKNSPAKVASNGDPLREQKARTGKLKKAEEVEYTGQVNNGEPQAPEWPRAALGVDAAGRKATPAPQTTVKDPDAQHVEPHADGQDFVKKVSELVVKMAKGEMKDDPEYAKMPWHKKYRADIGTVGGGVLGGVGGGVLGHVISKGHPEAGAVGAHIGALAGVIGGGHGGFATLSPKEQIAVLRQRHKEHGEVIRKADEVLKSDPGFLRRLWNRGEKAQSVGAQQTLKDMIAERKEKMKSSADLTEAKRDDLGKKEFALPKQRKFPIHDEAHARNALARASQFGSPAVQAKVRSAVSKKYPGIDLTSASKPEKPTVKKTITKTSMMFGQPLMRVADIAAHAPKTTEAGLEVARKALASKAGKSVPISAVRRAVPPPTPAMASIQPLASRTKIPVSVNQSLVARGMTPIV